MRRSGVWLEKMWRSRRVMGLWGSHVGKVSLLEAGGVRLRYIPKQGRCIEGIARVGRGREEGEVAAVAEVRSKQVGLIESGWRLRREGLGKILARVEGCRIADTLLGKGRGL